jgi:hypothetical protein
MSFVFVCSSYNFQGIAELVEQLLEVTLKQPYMGGQIPTIFLDLEQYILAYVVITTIALVSQPNICCRRNKENVIDYESVNAHALSLGLLDATEV